MKAFNQIVLLVFVLSFMCTEVNGQINLKQTATLGRGVIVGKDGAAFRTNANGECPLVIPDWLFQRIKKDPAKYKLKISILKIPSTVLDSKVVASPNAKVLKQSTLLITYKVKNGNQEFNGSNSTVVNKENIASVSIQRIDLSTFSLSNTSDPNVNLNLFLTGEPIPGAEIYVELEPEDEP